MFPERLAAARYGRSRSVWGSAALALAVSSALLAAGAAGAPAVGASTTPGIQIISGDGADYLGWGAPAVGVGLDPNEGVATDSQGDIYVASTFDGMIGKIDRPSTWTSQQVDYLAPFSELAWGINSFETITKPPSITRTTVGGHVAVRWQQQDVGANTWIQASPSPYLTVGDSYTARVTVEGSGRVYLDFYNGAVDVVSKTVTLSGTPQTLTVPATAQGTGTPQFQVRTPVAESSVDVTAYDGSIVGTAVTGKTELVAGDTHEGYSGNGGPATKAELNYPGGVAVSSSGDVFIADTGNNVIREVTPDGTISTVAGDGTAGYAGNGGPATKAELNSPESVAVNSSGDLFIADTENNVIREVTPDGTISTVAGTGTAGYAGNGGPATKAELCLPEGLAVGGSGDLFIADTCNNVIRKVSPGGTISTVAGTGTAGYSGNGGPATKAELDAPYGVAVDGAGDLFIADTANSVIREVTAAGVISTVAGNGVPSASAELDNPTSVAVDDTTGDLYTVDGTGAVWQLTGLPATAP
jgi:hypothetical protein